MFVWAGFGLPQLGSGGRLSRMACLWLGWNRFGRAELDWQASASLSWIWLGSPELDGVRFGRVGVGLDWFG